MRNFCLGLWRIEFVQGDSINNFALKHLFLFTDKQIDMTAYVDPAIRLGLKSAKKTTKCFYLTAGVFNKATFDQHM